jgi:hypothetical protein
MRYKRNFVIAICLFLFSYIFFPLFTLANNPPDQNHSSLSVSSSVPADGQTTAIITVTLHDSSGNPVVGDSVTLSDPSNSGATITNIISTTDKGGHVLFSIKSTNTQTDNLNITDTTSNTTFYNFGKISFTTVGCYDSAPGSTSTLTSAIANGSNKITLTWTDAANPVTRYLISYGLASGKYIYGSPNVGGQGTTSYTVGSLSSGNKYYFVVQAINGCAPGNFSNELSATAGDVVVNTPTPTQTPTIYISPKINKQNTISPTKIFYRNVITPTDSPTPSQSIQPTTVPIPTVTPIADSQKEKILLFISICILVIGSYGGFLYYYNKKKLKEPINTIKDNQPS